MNMTIERAIAQADDAIYQLANEDGWDDDELLGWVETLATGVAFAGDHLIGKRLPLPDGMDTPWERGSNGEECWRLARNVLASIEEGKTRAAMLSGGRLERLMRS